MSFGPLEIGLILVIVLLIFGSKKLKTLGSDLGQAIKGFRASMGGEKNATADATANVEPSDSKPKAAK